MSDTNLHPMFYEQPIDYIARAVYPITYKSANRQLHEALEELGRKNNLIQDVQTYSFIYKKYFHYSMKTSYATKKPILDSSLHEEAQIIYQMANDLYSEYQAIRRMLATVMSSFYKLDYLSLLPSELHTVFPNTIFDRSEKHILTQDQIDAFQMKFSKPLEDLRVRVLLNSLTQ